MRLVLVMVVKIHILVLWIVTPFVWYFEFVLARQPPVGQRPLIHKVSSLHTSHHSRKDSSGRVISLSPIPLPDNTQHLQQTSMPPVGFQPTISAGERAQTNAMDRAATVWYLGNQISEHRPVSILWISIIDSVLRCSCSSDLVNLIGTLSLIHVTIEASELLLYLHIWGLGVCRHYSVLKPC
jgi:hypothetical protein